MSNSLYRSGNGHNTPNIVTPPTAPPLSSLSTQLEGVAISPSPSTDRFPSGIAGSHGARNPLSLRLYKSLSSKFEDSASRQALETLSQLYSNEGSAFPHLKTPVHSKHTDSGDDSEEDGEGSTPRTLSKGTNSSTSIFAQSFAGNPPLGDISIAERARKNSRRDVEQQLIGNSVRFLTAFGDVNEKLDALQEHVDEMRARCDEAQTELAKTSESCRVLLEKAGSLRSQRQTTTIRQSIISVFLQRFTLTNAEIESITSHDIPVGKSLFAAMDHAEKIREDCLILLSGVEGAETKAGIDIMTRTAEQLDAAYAKVERWCSFEFRQLGKDSLLEVTPTLREAVRRLRNRPESLSSALTELTIIRQTTLLNSFIAALTKGGPSGLPRPIELHAHDPIRYVGHMLAWIHQAMASEKEFLDSLFPGSGDSSMKRMVGSEWLKSPEQGRDNAPESEEASWVRELMDRNLEKLCAPLRVRVQQTIKSQEGSITAYKISNLLNFYLQTMKRTIGEEALLTQTLQTLTDLSTKVFFDNIESQGRSLLRFLHPPEIDLSPPLALRDVSQVIREIMSVYDSSMLESPSSTGEKAEFDRIMDAAVGPALEMCKRMAELMKAPAGGASSKTSLNWDRQIFLVNCTVHLQSTFHSFAFAEARVDQMDDEVDQHVQVLAKEHYTLLLSESGLSEIIAAIKSIADSPLSRHSKAGPQAISVALSTFDTFLSSLDVLTSPRLALLTTPTISSRIHRSALLGVGKAYSRVADAIRDPKNKYEFATTVLGTKRPFGQMNVLWQVLNINESEVEADVDYLEDTVPGEKGKEKA